MIHFGIVEPDVTLIQAVQAYSNQQTREKIGSDGTGETVENKERGAITEVIPLLGRLGIVSHGG